MVREALAIEERGSFPNLKLLSVVNAVHVDSQLDHLGGVAALVVVPGDNLHELVVQSDAGAGIENGGTGITDEIRGNAIDSQPFSFARSRLLR